MSAKGASTGLHQTPLESEGLDILYITHDHFDQIVFTSKTSFTYNPSHSVDLCEVFWRKQ